MQKIKFVLFTIYNLLKIGIQKGQNQLNLIKIGKKQVKKGKNSLKNEKRNDIFGIIPIVS